MEFLDLKLLSDARRQDDPFRHVIVPHFLRSDRLREVNADFPAIERAGNFPIEDLTYGPQFEELIDEIRSTEFQHTIEEKLDVDLNNLHPMITVRAFSHKTDGSIHTDSPAKRVTALIYLNENWDSSGGRLRLLRNPNDIEDYAAEVPPDLGTLLLFKRSDNSWHGHKPFVGPRRTIQINWVTEAAKASKRYRPVTVTRRLRRWLGLET